ncbi:MAG: ABC transporter ATP-binding protein [Clostridia bacterium]|nr:ABC transporter ATP-binding protein [Clostridia bacterium]
MDDALLELRGLSKTFDMGKGEHLRAVRDVSLTVRRGESLGIVGESGCGKSTIARMVAQLTEVSGGRILFDGRDVTHLPRGRRRELWRRVQMVFQDPYSVFSPRMTVGDFLTEGLVHFGIAGRAAARERLPELLARVELPPELAERLPHQLSGGQQQRVVIARALSIQPDLLILDEATSALDVSVQRQILKLLMRLKEELGLTMLFIGHDLAVVRSVTDRIAVMYAGSLVEQLPSDRLVETAAHPYTRRLLDSVFSTGDRGRKQIAIEDLSLIEKGRKLPGCPYQPRCAVATGICAGACPSLTTVGEDHSIACFVRQQEELQ